MESKKNLQNRRRCADRKRTSGCWREGIIRDFREVTCTLLYLKWVMAKGLRNSTWNLLSVMCQAGRDGGLGENGSLCMCGWVSLLVS